MSRRRTPIDITATILALGDSGATITKMTIRAGMSSANARKNVTQLESSGLLRYDASENKYFISAKGRMFLEIYDQMSQQESVLEIIKDKDSWPLTEESIAL